MEVRSGDPGRAPGKPSEKAGTPTGGGILFAALGIVAGVLATIAGHAGALPATAGLLVGAVIGFADDRSKLQVGARGIPARLKFPIQLALAIPLAWFALAQGVGISTFSLNHRGSCFRWRWWRS